MSKNVFQNSSQSLRGLVSIWIVVMMTVISSACSSGKGDATNETSKPGETQAPRATPRENTDAPIDPTRSVCGVVDLTTRDLHFCYRDIANRAGSPREIVPVLYYFHGLGGDVGDLFAEEGELIYSGLKRIFGDEMPIVVSLSLGSEGVFASDSSEIANRGLSAIESRMAPGKKLRRIAVGGSMGAHNALRMVAEDPKKFQAVAALCPALATFDGHDSAGVQAYEARHRSYLDESFFDRALAIYKRQLPTSEAWWANNPFTFLERGAYDGLPIFVSVGREDTLGFVEGAREFSSRLASRSKGRVTYSEVRGPHCVFDLIDFLDFTHEAITTSE